MQTSDLFANAVRKSIAQDLSVTDLLGAIDALTKAGDRGLTIELYRIWIQHNLSNPLIYAVYFNFGVVLADANDLQSAKEALTAATEINPAFIPAYINLGNVLDRMGAADKAIAQWTKAADTLASVTGEAISYRTTAMKQIGRVFEGAKLESSAEDVLRRSLEINPRQRDVIQHWLALRQSQCKWPLMQTAGTLDQAELMQSISPLSLAVLSDDPIFQIASSYNYNKRDVGMPAAPRAFADHAASNNPAKRLRIGYVSSDLREHAVGFLMSEVFELHDRANVEIFAYYCGIPSNDGTNARFKRSADQWRDLTGLTDQAAADMIEKDGIDILVDLNGYTKDARLKLFALRPAPIIVNWLGFPGTTGSGYHNYIIADGFTIPRDAEAYFSEKVMRLPCYQPNDRKRVVAEPPTRADAGLPEDAFVFCCFNGTQKITKVMFETWMQILSRATNSVLWLLTGTPDTNERIKDLAAAHGIDRDRVIFAPRKVNPEHLARYPLADVFLDTFPYGAHTTASDALWMGVPVLTVPGRSFASRVCGSLVSAAGLSELICPSFESFADLAVSLADDREAVKTLKAKLVRNRTCCALFDTPGLVRHLEANYREMWNDFLSGRLHRPDLSNLETIHEIGCSLDHEALQGRIDDDMRQVYRQKFRERSAERALAYDRRLSYAGATRDYADYESELTEAQTRALARRPLHGFGPASDEVSLQ